MTWWLYLIVGWLGLNLLVLIIWSVRWERRLPTRELEEEPMNVALLEGKIDAEDYFAALDRRHPSAIHKEEE
jgi:hypothetical protein